MLKTMEKKQIETENIDYKSGDKKTRKRNIRWTKMHELSGI